MSVKCSRVVELSLLESLHYRSSGLVRLSRVFALQFLTYPLHFYFYYIGPLCSAMLISLCVGPEVCLSGMTKRCTYVVVRYFVYVVCTSCWCMRALLWCKKQSLS